MRLFRVYVGVIYGLAGSWEGVVTIAQKWLEQVKISTMSIKPIP